MPKITIIKIIHFTIDFLLAGFYKQNIAFFYFELTIVVLLILDILRVKVCHIVRAG